MFLRHLFSRKGLAWIACASLLTSAAPWTTGQDAGSLEERLKTASDSAQTLADRSAALDALGSLGSDARPAAPNLLALVQDSSHPVELRHRAALALSQIGLEDAAEAEALFRVFADSAEPSSLRQTLFDRFAEQPRWRETAVPFLLSVLGDPDESEALRVKIASQFLSVLEPSRESIRVFGELLSPSSNGGRLRMLALRHLFLAGDQAKPAESTLARIVASESQPSAVRLECLRVLEQFQSLEPATASALADVLKSESQWNEVARKCLSILKQSNNVPSNTRRKLRSLLFDANAVPDLRLQLLPVVKQWPDLPSLPNESREFVDQALNLASDDETPPELRAFATDLLLQGRISGAQSELLAHWKRLFLDRSLPLSSRLAVFNRMLSLPPAIMDPMSAMTRIERVLEDSSEAIEIKRAAADWLERRLFDEIKEPETLSRQELNERLRRLQGWQDRFTAGNLGESEELRRLIQLLRSEQNSRVWDSARNWAERRQLHKNPWALTIAFAAGYFLLMSLAWAAMARLDSSRLIRTHERLTRRKIPFLGSLSLSQVLLCSRWATTSKALNDWIRRNLPLFQTAMKTERTGKAHPYFFTRNTMFQGQTFDPRNARFWEEISRKDRSILVFQGPSGCGKTRWIEILSELLMSGGGKDSPIRLPCLPVRLKSQDLLDCESGAKSFEGCLLKAIQQAVPGVGPGQLRALQKQKRLAWIIDDLDLWTPKTQEALEHGLNSLPCYWIIASAHGPDATASSDTAIVEVSPLAPDQFSEFFHEYLQQSTHGHIKDEHQVLEAAQQLASISHGSPVPHDLAVLYIECAAQPGGAKPRSGLPSSFNEVVYRCLQYRFALEKTGKLGWEPFLNASLRLGWLACQDRLHPSPVRQSDLDSEKDLDWKPVLKKLAPELAALEESATGQRCFLFVRPSLARLLAVYGLMHGARKDRGKEWKTARRALEQCPAWIVSPFAWLLSVNAIHDPQEDLKSYVPEEIEGALEKFFEPGRAPYGDFKPAFQTDRLLLRALNPHEPDRESLIDKLKQHSNRIAHNLPVMLDKASDPRNDIEVRLAALELLKSVPARNGGALGPLLGIVVNGGEEMYFRIKAFDILAAAGPLDDASRNALKELADDPAQPKFLRARIQSLFSVSQSS